MEEITEEFGQVGQGKSYVYLGQSRQRVLEEGESEARFLWPVIGKPSSLQFRVTVLNDFIKYQHIAQASTELGINSNLSKEAVEDMFLQ